MEEPVLLEEDQDLPVVQESDEAMEEQYEQEQARGELDDLRSYKDLCEQRIRELSPNHPLPMRGEYLGAPASGPSTEVFLLKQKIARLEQQLAQQQFHAQLYEGHATETQDMQTEYHRVSNEKAAVEESLRAEMLHSEEQRSYIEVLKQALEARIADLGIAASVDAFADYTQAKTTADQLRRSHAKAQYTVNEQETYIKKLNEQLRNSQQECEYLAEEKAKTYQNLKEAAEALKFAEEEVQQLEEEKNSLLEYIEGQDNKLKAGQAEMQEYRQRLASVTKELHNLQLEHSQKKDEFIKLDAKFKVTAGEAERTESSLREVQQSYVHAKARIEEKDKLIAETRHELQTVQTRHSNAQDELSQLQTVLEQKTQDLEHARREGFQYLNDNSSLYAQTEQLESALSQLNHEKTSLQQELQTVKEERGLAQQRGDQLSAELRQIQEKSSFLEAELAATKETERDRFEQCKYLNGQLDAAKCDYSKLLARFNKTESDKGSLVSTVEQLEGSLRSVNQAKQFVDEQVQRMQSALDSEQSENQGLSEELRALKGRHEEVLQSLSLSKQSCNDLDRELTRTKSQLHTVQQDLAQTQYTSNQLEQQRTDLHRELERVNNEFESAERQAEAFKQETEYYHSQEKQELNDRVNKALEDIEDLQNEKKEVTYELAMLQNELEGLRNRDSTLSMQLEKSAQDARVAREDNSRRVDALYAEITANRKEIQQLQEENYALRQDCQALNNERTELIQKEEVTAYNLKLVEEKYSLLQQEFISKQTARRNYDLNNSKGGVSYTSPSQFYSPRYTESERSRFASSGLREETRSKYGSPYNGSSPARQSGHALTHRETTRN